MSYAKGWRNDTAAKKKSNKKKKNANKNKEPAQTSNGDARIDKDEADEEPETPTTAVSLCPSKLQILRESR
jgi:hypothetical protein